MLWIAQIQLAQICPLVKRFRRRPESDRESCEKRHGKPRHPSDSGEEGNSRNPRSPRCNCGRHQSTATESAYSSSGLLPENILDVLQLALRYPLPEANSETLYTWRAERMSQRSFPRDCECAGLWRLPARVPNERPILRA